MQDPLTKTDLGQQAYDTLSKLMQAILGQPHDKYDVYTQMELYNINFTQLVKDYRKKLQGLELFRKIEADWTVAFNDECGNMLVARLEQTGRIVTKEEVGNMKAELDKMPAMEAELSKMPAMQAELDKVAAMQAALNTLQEELAGRRNTMVANPQLIFLFFLVIGLLVGKIAVSDAYHLLA